VYSKEKIGWRNESFWKGQFFLTITDDLLRLKDIVSSTSGYHLCLNCNLTKLFYSMLLYEILKKKLSRHLFFLIQNCMKMRVFKYTLLPR